MTRIWTITVKDPGETAEREEVVQALVERAKELGVVATVEVTRSAPPKPEPEPKASPKRETPKEEPARRGLEPEEELDGEEEEAEEEEDLDSLTVPDLRQRAKAAAIEDYAKMTKAELVAALQESSDAGRGKSST